MAKAKFTFRKEPRETGLRAVGHPYPATAIKFSGEEIGRISPPWFGSKDGKWGVGLRVLEKASDSCEWGWMFFKARFDTEPEAREFVTRNQATILSKWTLALAGTERGQENAGENITANSQESDA